MGFREVSVVEVCEVLRAWLEGAGLRKVAERAGVDRKTARRYVAAAEAAGLARDAGVEAVTDELVGEVVEAVRPARPNGHGRSWELLLGHEAQIRGWVSGSTGEDQGGEPLSIVKIEELLARQGVRVPYRTVHRFAVERCGFAARTTTVRVADGEPGVECHENDKPIWPHCAVLIWPHPACVGLALAGVGRRLLTGSVFGLVGGVEPIRRRAGLDDVGVEGQPVDDGGGPILSPQRV